MSSSDRTYRIRNVPKTTVARPIDATPAATHAKNKLRTSAGARNRQTPASGARINVRLDLKAGEREQHDGNQQGHRYATSTTPGVARRE